ncbi:MAG: (d)CMP kinase [bacterium]
MDKKCFVIAIDGPAGSGKSTVAQAVARELGYLHVDSGSMYRALTWKALKDKVDINDKAAVIKSTTGARIGLRQQKGKQRVFIDGKDVTYFLRGSEINENINTIAAIPEVRKYLLNLQREIAKEGGIVMEGRDIGTVVFPDAQKKFYLDASIKERTRRRFEELVQKREIVDVLELEESIKKRDKKDKTRSTNPLRIADDAIVIDTTGLSVDDVIKKILEKISR